MEQRLAYQESEFKAWMSHHGKVYASVEEFAHRFKIFSENSAYIRVHNEQGHSYTLGTTKFADMTHEEFRALVSNPRPSSDPRSRSYVDLSVVAAADSIDWRTKGVVTPVKDQGSCGSCWSFSATGSIEGAYAIATGTLKSFSEQQLVDCSWAFGNAGCGGGWMDNAFQYAESTGLETESDYPYTGEDGSCSEDPSKFAVKVTSYVDVQTNSDSALAAALNVGPVSIAIEADQSAFQFYTRGIINMDDCGSNLDHGVLAVGYTADAWIVKNSWGPSWGEQGYVRLQRVPDASVGTCGVLLAPSYPLV
jgi:C1A family cysteine protease